MNEAASSNASVTRVDHELIAEMVEAGSRVLDVGCGDGELLHLLAERKGVDGRGVEIDRDKVNTCVASGLSVIQGDADRDLSNYPDKAFDYVAEVCAKVVAKAKDMRGYQIVQAPPSLRHFSAAMIARSPFPDL